MPIGYTVYMHIFPNGKCYIGITKQDPPSKRWNRGSGYYEQPKMKSAIKKYKWRNITHKIIASDLTLEQAAELERRLIREYDSIKNGYNITYGGEGGSLGVKHSSDSKAKISASMKGNTNASKHSFDEYRDTVGAWNCRKVQALDLETGEPVYTFRSVLAGAKYFGRSPSFIHKKIKHWNGIAYGFRWRYLDG